MGSGNLGLVYLMEERRRLTLEEMNERHPDLIPALRNHPHVGWLLVRSSEHGPVVLGGARHPLPRRRQGRGRGSARGVLAERAAAPPAHGRVHPRRRHHDRQLLRPGARDRLRVRGADLVPRRHRRPADAAVHPPSRPSSPCPTARSSAPPPCTRSCSAGGTSSTAPLRPRTTRAASRATVTTDALGPPLRARSRRSRPRGHRPLRPARRLAVRRRDLVPRALLARAAGHVRRHDPRRGALGERRQPAGHRRGDLRPAPPHRRRRRPARLADRCGALAVEPRRPRGARARALGCDRGDVVDAEDAGRRVRRRRRPQLRPRPPRQRPARARRPRADPLRGDRLDARERRQQGERERRGERSAGSRSGSGSCSESSFRSR